MKLRKILVPVLCILIAFTACKKDEADDIEVIPPRDRTVQQQADNDSIVKYLKSHYYNASAFDGNADSSIADLVITKKDGDIPDPDNNKLLFDSDSLKTIENIAFGDAIYKIYYLNLNTGGGQSPTFADNVRLNYEGFTLDNSVFDSSVNPADFDLTGVISGWRRVIPKFKTAANFVENGDGTVSYTNHGVGVMFIPSGLAYFSQSQTGISAYSPLIFKFDLFEMDQNDHDNDGVPSWMEDRNGDGEFFTSEEDQLDDTDKDGTLNIVDNDDDGDGVPTIREDIDGDGDPTNDIGKNGIAKYLDSEETEASKL